MLFALQSIYTRNTFFFSRPKTTKTKFLFFDFTYEGFLGNGASHRAKSIDDIFLEKTGISGFRVHPQTVSAIFLG